MLVSMLGKRKPSDEFSMLDVANCAIWLDSDLDITVTGQGVSLWEDQSGNGRDVSQDTDAKRLAYETNQVNGHAAVKGDGANKWLYAPSLSGLTSQAHLTLVNVVKQISYATPATFQHITDFSGNMCIDVASNTNGRVYVLTTGSTYGYYTGTGLGTDPVIVVTVYDGTQSAEADKLKVYVNGTQKTLTFVSTAPSSLSLSNFRVGAWDDNNRLFNGWHMTHALYTQTMGDTDRQYLEDGLGAKYGITVA